MTVWETKFLEHSPKNSCPLYVLYKIPLTQDGRTDGRTDGQTDGRTDKVNPVYPPSNFVGRGYKDATALLMHWSYGFLALPHWYQVSVCSGFIDGVQVASKSHTRPW